MDPSQEKSIVSNIVALKKRTVNISVLLTKLLQVGVLIPVEKDAILKIQDDEQRIELFYEIIMRKSSDAFQFLLQCLKESGNTSLAALVEETWLKSKSGANSNGKPQLKRGSSIDRYLKEDIGHISIKDYEMGIAELLEESDTLKNNWKLILHMLNFPLSKIKSYEELSMPTFVFKTTLMLRSWVNETKLKPNMGNLCSLVDKQGISGISVRIRQMFEAYSQEAESGFIFQFQSQANVPIHGQELEIIRVLEDNPDFGLKQEKLFLMLNLPCNEFPKYFKNHSKFIENATEMLKVWNESNGNMKTYLDLAVLLMQNGHRATSGKICVLSTI